ncbi:Bacteriophage protein [Mycobacteroides abscessus]|uniref:Bacteriophage protein n=3 Tax=Mycobacteroides abscessus TaxID=36809 RepID=A0A829HW41_9MYCO|nr:PE-PPE domain-containing protein [Mycobacteroides abscessus]ESV60719.1 cutinase family protein [Mycobacteroides abscessus MAB_082312_2258]ESV62728.1 cutinase family protein [Mycobacteroides abscessus MAB_091912_2446]AIC72525.1 hypothetical protein MYCMA_10720 [Mycobacteroides abscessus subsp. massiliense str. GO 06]AMU25354.1 hypothetical protein A3N96_07965 [Mycobacteroides abscessus]AMU35081.1 hypothetical protein A3N98_07425 [Mycobacteroides abscessus]
MNTPNALPKTTLIWAPGTWEADAADTAGENPAEDRAFGLGLWLVDWRFPNRLNQNRWSFKILVPPGYAGSFGPIPGGGKPPNFEGLSYQESVDAGVDYAVDVVNRTPGPLVLGGYSQGAELASRLSQEFINGRLATRANDLHAVVTFGNPRRASGREISWQPTLAFEGIGNDEPGGGLTAPVPWWDYCFPSDIYGNANPESFLRFGYDVLTDLQLHNPWELAGRLAETVSSGELLRRLDLHPESWWWRVTHPGLYFSIGRKTANTVAAVNEFLVTGAHGHYHDQPLWEDGPIPVWHAIGQLNALTGPVARAA